MPRLRDLSTRLKLLLFACAFTALLLVTSTAGLRANDALHAMLRTQYERDTLGLYDAEEAARASMTMAKEMRNAVLDDADPPMVAEFTDKFRANDRDFAVRVDALEKHVVGDEVAKLAEVREKFAVYHDFTDKVFDAARHRQDAEARRYLHELRAPFGRFQVLLTEIAESKKRLGREAYDESERVVSTQRARTIAVNAAAIFAALALALGIARSISRPLLETASILERVAAGDLAGRSDISSHDEVGRTAASLNHALDTLSNALRSVGERADTLTAASQSLSSIGEQLGTTSEDSSAQSNSVAAAAGQASTNVQTVAAATEQMNASAREIAKGTAEAAELARGGAAAAAEVHALVGDLARGSSEIEGVVKLISGIAGQTNLLALNATIEAARAGEAGKGFAVVADEVKELARASAAATGEISQRIAGIQSANTRAIEAIAKVAGFMSRISEQQALMAGAVEEQVRTTSEIGRNVGEAAKATEDIARSAVSVASAAQSTSQGARAALRQATALAGTATELHALMGQFKILPA